MKKKIALLYGDGIGPLILKQGVKVLNAVCERFDHHFDYCVADIGASAIEKYGNALPNSTLESCQNSDATIIGAVGDPVHDNDISSKDTPDQGLLRLRKTLELNYNVRPIRTFPTLLDISPLKRSYVKDVDFVIFRELSSGIYFGQQGRADDKTAFDECRYTVEEIERVARPAFEEAQKRKKKKLTLVDRANVLETSRLWREVVALIAKQYPEVEYNTLFIDHALAEMIMRPQQFDVILTTNLFGDLMSDAVGVITGSVRLIPSKSIGKNHVVFEPIYSAYPRGVRLSSANPIAGMLSVAMLLEHFDLKTEARTVRSAITRIMKRGIGTPDLNLKHNVSTAEMGDLVATYITEGGDSISGIAETGGSLSTII
ncbi:MAG: 3-isopropylmalate dehydrogenase [Bacteroidota bacterium]